MLTASSLFRLMLDPFLSLLNLLPPFCSDHCSVSCGDGRQIFLCMIYLLLTPLLPQPVKPPGWKMHGHACEQCISRSYNASTFNAARLDENPFTWLCGKGDKKPSSASNFALLLVVFKWRHDSEGVKCMVHFRSRCHESTWSSMSVNRCYAACYMPHVCALIYGKSSVGNCHRWMSDTNCRLPYTVIVRHATILPDRKWITMCQQCVCVCVCVRVCVRVCLSVSVSYAAASAMLIETATKIKTNSALICSGLATATHRKQ